MLSQEQVAYICHEANRTYCEIIGDYSQKPWAEAEQWQRDSAIVGVQYAREHPNEPASSQHDAWLADKVKAGWSYGPVKDASKKQHPCIVPYEDLPREQKFKDALFKGIVNSLS